MVCDSWSKQTGGSVSKKQSVVTLCSTRDIQTSINGKHAYVCFPASVSSTLLNNPWVYGRVFPGSSLSCMWLVLWITVFLWDLQTVLFLLFHLSSKMSGGLLTGEPPLSGGFLISFIRLKTPLRWTVTVDLTNRLYLGNNHLFLHWNG